MTDDPPPVNGDDPPDPNAQTVEQRAQAAEAALASAFDLTRDAIRAANPTLPDEIFAVADIPTLMHNVKIAQAAIAATKPDGNPDPNTSRTTTPPPPKLNLGTPPPEREPAKPPDGLRGSARIRWGLEQKPIALRNS